MRHTIPFQRLVIFIILLFLSQNQFSQIKWPAVTRESKPWTRWWWMGSAVNEKDLSYSLNEYAKAGLGGMEIVPIYGVKGYESQFIDYLTPEWMKMLDYTLKTAQKYDLGIDMANGTGWPFGGPWIQEDHASKTIYFKTYELNSNESLKEKIQYQTDGYLRTANGKNLDLKQLKQPVTSNNNLQLLAIDQIRYPGILKPQIIMAYGENGQAIDITSKLNVEDNLNWTAPSGKWKIYAIFQALHGKMVERAAPGGEGYAIDHFSEAAIKKYFDKFDKSFSGHDIGGIRALFNDSYEVDDALGEANWTPDFLNEFAKRRGYNLTDFLPALFKKDTDEVNNRVIYDYRETINELLLENYTLAWRKWAHSKGKIIRNQSHGSPANILDLYAIADIPETEGNDVVHFKFASSAANITGKKLVSAEAATWLDEHFLSTLSRVKKSADRYFLGGVNHIFYHGMAYSPQDEPWPGWLFYAAVHFQPTNPFWIHFPTLNNYIAHCQAFLQNSRPDNDILCYYPLADRFSEPSNELLRHFHGMDKEFINSYFERSIRELHEKGYSFDLITDKQLLQTTLGEDHINIGSGNYQTVVIPQCSYMPYKTWDHILKNIVSKGATVIFCNELPRKVPGIQGINQEKELESIIKNIRFISVKEGITKGVYGKGSILICQNIDEALMHSNIRQEKLVGEKIQFIRKVSDGKTLYFLVNNSSEKFDGWLPLQLNARSVVLFNAMTGQSGLTQLKTGTNSTSVYLQLYPGESIIAEASKEKIKGTLYPFFNKKDLLAEIKGPWEVSFVSGGPTLPQSMVLQELKSLTDLNNNDLQYFSGHVVYKTQFSISGPKAKEYILDLGEVKESAEIKINGKSVATLLGDNYQTIVDASLLKETNELEIIVANNMVNRIIHLEQSGTEWKKFYNINFQPRLPQNRGDGGVFSAKNWQVQPSGLLGPVKIFSVIRK